MKLTYYGTSASEAWPALFCDCEACRMAKELGGKNIRSRSQALVGETLLLDFPPDTNYHAQKLNLNLKKVRSLLITHSHHDHFFPYDIFMRAPQFTDGEKDFKLTIYGNATVEEMFFKAAESFLDPGPIEFQRLSPFQKVSTEDEYIITALLADHNQPEESLIYIIEKHGQSLLYAHDTGIFPETTWKSLEGKYFHLVSLDCTGLSRDWNRGHMGFASVFEVKERLQNMGCIDERSILVLSHFAHYGDFTHEKICHTAEKYGFSVAYNGFMLEF